MREPIRQLWPLLLVQDIERSVEFYRDVLAFAVVGRAEREGRLYWCRLERGGACLMLQEAESDAPPREHWRGAVGFYFVCDDCDALHAELTSRGLELQQPRTAHYGMRQLPVPEPDGYRIWFESPTQDWNG